MDPSISNACRRSASLEFLTNSKAVDICSGDDFNAFLNLVERRQRKPDSNFFEECNNITERWLTFKQHINICMKFGTTLLVSQLEKMLIDLNIDGLDISEALIYAKENNLVFLESKLKKCSSSA